MPDLAVRRRVHVVGVGGPGMSALATVLAGMGHAVSGSDVVESPVLSRLRAAGVDVRVGHDAAHVRGCDAVTGSPAIPGDHLEYAAARAAGVPVVPRSAALAAVCGRARSLGVAGTHGKTTTTAMLWSILEAAGARPSALVGADVAALGAAARWTGGEWFVVEVDESDASHLALPLRGAVLTNVDADHLDRYGTTEALRASFVEALVRVDGPVAVCADDPGAASVAAAARAAGARDVVTYGLADGADVRATAVRTAADGLEMRLAGGPVRVRAQGLHNARNALGAAALASRLGVPHDAIRDGLAAFAGVSRRFEHRGVDGGATFVDDYAHLPAEIAATLAGVRAAAAGWRRVVAVFQPNRFHRMAVLSPEYRDAFVDADVAVVTEIYASGTAPIPGVTGRLVVDAVRGAHPDARVEWIPAREDLVAWLAGELREGDLCVSMGCGDVAGLPDEVMHRRAALRA